MKDFTATIEVEKPAQEVFHGLLEVSKWWSKDFEGSSAKLNDDLLLAAAGARGECFQPYGDTCCNSGRKETGQTASRRFRCQRNRLRHFYPYGEVPWHQCTTSAKVGRPNEAIKSLRQLHFGNDALKLESPTPSQGETESQAYGPVF